MKEILQQVRQYIQDKQTNKTWTAGRDFVNYAGAYYNEDEYVAGVESLLKGWLAMGSESLKFERQFPRQFGKAGGIVTNSGSSSNLLMMASLTSKRGYNLPRGTRVLMPIAGFPTTLNPTLQVGFEPVFVDIELDTLNIDLDQAQTILENNPDIRVITFAHVLGNPPNMDQLMQLVNKHNLILLEDCCDALGSTYDNRPLGSFGLMASCSFYPAHHMTMNLRNNFGRLAETLLEAGKRDSAMNVLDKCIKEMPDKSVPYNIMMIRVAEMYYGVANYGSSPGRAAITDPNNPSVVLVPAIPASTPIPFPRSKEATENADQIMKRLGEIYENDFNYYASLKNTEFFSGVQDELGQSVAVLRELERIANNYERTEIAAIMRKKYEMAESKLYTK